MMDISEAFLQGELMSIFGAYDFDNGIKYFVDARH